MTYTQVLDPMTLKPSDRMIQRDEDGAFIPFDVNNVDYIGYRKWLEAGNEPKPAQKPAAAQEKRK